MQINSKLPDVGITIFTVMSKLAADTGAINLSQGYPDFDVHSRLIALVHRFMRDGYNQYAPMQGVLALREQIAAKVANLYGASYDPLTEITVTSGATEALFAAISAVVQTGDEVLVFEPAYDSYAPAISLNGGRAVYLKLSFPDYRIDWQQVRQSLTPRTRLIILNSPHNPTGTVLTGADIEALKALVGDTDLLIISDEVYEHIVFDGQPHHSMACYPELAQRSFVISSFGKTYHATGWKIGYCVAPAALSREFQKVHQYLTFASNTPVQHALAEFMQDREHYDKLAAFYQSKRDKFLALTAASRFKPLACSGTYFQMMDYRAISNEPDTVMAKRLTTAMGVAAIPPSVFYHQGDDHKVLRFCFAKADETLERAAQILCRI